MTGMKRYSWPHRLFVALSLLGCAAGWSACSVPDSDGEEPFTGSVPVGFTISSRAAADDGHEFERGTEAEYRIDKNKLYLYLFERYAADGTELSEEDAHLIARFEPSSITEAGVSAEEGIDYAWYVEGELDAAVANRCQAGFRLVVLANCDEQPKVPTNAADQTLQRIVNPSEGLPLPAEGQMVLCGKYIDELEAGTRSLPMYGCRNFGPKQLLPNGRVDLGGINLLRSLAKIEVYFATDDVVDVVTLFRGPMTYNIGPGSLEKDTSHDASDWYNPTQNVWEEQQSFQYLFNKQVAPESQKCVFRAYVPDMGIVDADWPSTPYIYFWLDNHVYLYLGKEALSGIRQFVRNHCYRFYVTREAGVTLKYTVCPWEEQTSGTITFD